MKWFSYVLAKFLETNKQTNENKQTNKQTNNLQLTFSMLLDIDFNGMVVASGMLSTWCWSAITHGNSCTWNKPKYSNTVVMWSADQPAVLWRKSVSWQVLRHCTELCSKPNTFNPFTARWPDANGLNSSCTPRSWPFSKGAVSAWWLVQAEGWAER